MKRHKPYFKEKLPKRRDAKDLVILRKPYFTTKIPCNNEKTILVERSEVLK